MGENKRIVYFDFLKAFLIVSVVLGHAIDTFSLNSSLKTVYLFLYAFHMPLFVFISGFFAKWKFEKFLAYFLIYFVFSALQIILKVLIASSTFTFSNIIKMFLYPQWTLWFLPAMAIWLLSVKLIKKVKPWHIIVALIATLIIGFVPFIGSKFTLSRIFYFFPFFMFGRWCGQNKEKFHYVVQKLQKNYVKILCGLTLVLAIVVIALLIKHIPKTYFYGKNAYTNYIDILHRFLSIIIGIITGFCVMMLIPYKTQANSSFSAYISSIGQKTLSIYLFHTLILLIFKQFCAGYFSKHWLISFGVSLLISITIVIVTSLKPFVNSVNFMLNCLSGDNSKWKR